MALALLDLEGLPSVVCEHGSKKIVKWWRILTGNGKLWTIRFIYLDLFIVYMTLLPILLHPLESLAHVINDVLNFVWRRPLPRITWFP